MVIGAEHFAIPSLLLAVLFQNLECPVGNTDASALAGLGALHPQAGLSLLQGLADRYLSRLRVEIWPLEGAELPAAATGVRCEDQERIQASFAGALKQDTELLGIENSRLALRYPGKLDPLV